MKKIGLICIILLLGLSLAGCNNLASQQAHKPTHQSSSSSYSVKMTKHYSDQHKKYKNREKNSNKRKNSSIVSISNTNSIQDRQNSQTQTSNVSNINQSAVEQSSGNNQQAVNQQQDERPSDVPANFKEYTSYTTNGHKMTQWNDAGSYQGDPDVQYDTNIKMNQSAQSIVNGHQ